MTSRSIEELTAELERSRYKGCGSYPRAIGEIEAALGITGEVPLSETVDAVRKLREYAAACEKTSALNQQENAGRNDGKLIEELKADSKRSDSLRVAEVAAARRAQLAAESALASARELLPTPELLRADKRVPLENKRKLADLLESLTSHPSPAPVAEKSETNRAYTERNRLVAALARHYPSGLRATAIDGWDTAWNGCCFIDTPEGQMSWHYHEDDAGLFAGLPPYEKPWDGHTTPEKYERLARLSSVAAPCSGCAAARELLLNLNECVNREDVRGVIRAWLKEHP